jgi:hypothetical protein
MARNIRSALAAVAFIALASTPAAAQSARQFNWCMNQDEAFSPNLRIDGCTAAIQSGRQTGENLIAAFYNRGIA